MEVTRRGDIYRVARITGPTHNYLAIRFGKPDGRKPDVVSLDDGVKVRLDASKVRDEVSKGVADANKRLGTSYEVALIQFVPDDSPPEAGYRELAVRIVEDMHRGTVPDEI